MKSLVNHFKVTDLAAPISALLLYLGVGLHPLALATWLFLVPLLLVAPRVSAKRAAALAGIAGVAGQAGLAGYFVSVLHMPPFLLLILVAYIAALVIGVVLLSRAFILHQRELAGLLVVPSFWVCGEYLLTIIAPHGAWWSIGYSQADVLPILQLASLSGVWTISFAIIAVSVAIASIFTPQITRAVRYKVSVAALLGLLFVGGYGAYQLRQPVHTNQALRAAVTVTAHPSEEVPVSSKTGQQLIQEYGQQIATLAKQKAQVIVLPEKGFQSDKAALHKLTDPLHELALRNHVTVIVGVMVKTAPETYENVAIALSGNNSSTSTYLKQHMIPGLESDFDEGDVLTFVPNSNHKQGIIICKDLDFPSLVRSYRKAGATVLFAPAWDFNSDGKIHSRIAITRGVENGMGIVRNGRDGQLTISDARGRILAEQSARENIASTIITNVPLANQQTFYTKYGDWIVGIGAVVLLAGIIDLKRYKKRLNK